MRNNKKNIHVTIDDEIWFYFRSINVNLSQKVNEILRLQMDINKDNREEVELQEQLEEMKSARKKIDSEMMNLTTQLVMKKQEREEKEKLDFEEAVIRGQSIKASGILRDLI